MTSLIDVDTDVDIEDATADLTADLVAEQPRIAASSPKRSAHAHAQAAPVAPAKGVTLRGRYVLEETIANGGTSVIFRARDLRHESESGTSTYVAVKVLRPELHATASAIERLKREFRHAQSLTHPNVVRVFDLDCEGDRWFMTMELLEGDSLSSLLKQNNSATLPPRRINDILRACGEALGFAHERGVVHGDFKPGNVFITRNGQVRVLDFGAATSTSPTGEEHFPSATFCYASPEVLSGSRPERRDDIFSFACVAYELLNGKHPFERRSSLEAHTRRMTAPRAWNLNDRQWFPLEAALAFRRDARPANIRPLVSELLCAEILPPLVFPTIAADLPSISAPPRELHPRAQQRKPQQPRVQSPPPPKVAAPAARPSTPNWIRTMAAVVTLALVAVIAYSRVRQSLKESPPVMAQTSVLPPSPAAQITTPPPVVQPRIGPRIEQTNPDRNTIAAPPQRQASVRNLAPTVPRRAFTPAHTGPRSLISFNEPSITVSEGAGAAVLTLHRQQQLSGRTLLHWRVIPGSAQPGQDYVEGAAGMTEFPDGHNRRAIYIPLLRDAIAESREDFTVELYDAADDAQIWPIARATVKIVDDDH